MSAAGPFRDANRAPSGGSGAAQSYPRGSFL
jgi:hypothetical protein